jgi:S-adenosylmethionine:tRNA ribosyltransferase-isomerase
MLTDFRDRGIAFATITLAAGLSSTGDPDLDARLPLDEAYHVPVGTVAAIERTWEVAGRVIAVGTTATRALEHAARHGELRSGPGLATGRIGPGTPLRVVDAILSGIHEPGSSHYDLLRAFAPEVVLYRMTDEVAAHRYRPHEFGDSALVSRHHHLHEFASSGCKKGLPHAITID